MIPDRDIWRDGNLLIREHGADAEVVAARRSDSVREFTVRAVIAGIVFGIVFGAANAYLGLRVGLTVSTSIPIAVLTVALFRLMRLLGYFQA